MPNLTGSTGLEQAKWQIWRQDNFDLECSREVVLSGVGIIQGLTELWMRHLYETIRPEGLTSFTRFNLWCKDLHCSIDVVGDFSGQIKLREWVFGNSQAELAAYVDIADSELLKIVAKVHYELLIDDKTSEPIMDAAGASSSRQDFTHWLRGQISD